MVMSSDHEVVVLWLCYSHVVVVLWSTHFMILWYGGMSRLSFVVSCRGCVIVVSWLCCAVAMSWLYHDLVML